MSSSTWKAFVAVGLAAAFASGCCCHRIPLLSPVLIGGPPFEPHVQQEAGKAVVYLYWWIPDIGEADGWAILPMYGRVRHLYYYVNGRKTAPFVMGGYSVVEVPPGTIEVEIAADPNEVDPTLLCLGRPLWFARLTFRAEADQNYYVWAHYTYRSSRNGLPADVEYELALELEPLALTRLKGLRKQEELL